MIYDASLPMSPEAEARWAAILEWAEREMEELGPGEARQIMASVPVDSGRPADELAKVVRKKLEARYAWQERADLCG